MTLFEASRAQLAAHFLKHPPIPKLECLRNFDMYLDGFVINAYPIMSATLEIYRLSKPGDIQFDMICILGNVATDYYVDQGRSCRQVLILQFYRFGEWKMAPFSGLLDGLPRRYPPNFWVVWVPCNASRVVEPVDRLIEILPDERSTETDSYIYNFIAEDVVRAIFPSRYAMIAFDYFPVHPRIVAKAESLYSRENIKKALRNDTVTNVLRLLTLQCLVKMNAAARWAYTGVDYKV
ncbi:hypothetical protein BC832DRAFT_596202 [Gaertneriomyces semiglobifer]|nr:hypothetical protein BC832DRAFT_596202 [Gaertneriomyces semiglobifer]